MLGMSHLAHTLPPVDAATSGDESFVAWLSLPDDVRPDVSSRLFLRWIARTTSSRKSAPGTLHSAEEALAKLRRSANRPSFPKALSSLQVRRVLDVRVPGATELRPARLYVPYGRVQGVVLYLHGGGFVHCGLDSHHGICCRLARASGAAVLSFDYRLAPEHKFPAAPDDCWAAFRWLTSEAWRWGGRIAVAGDSAGGGLAAFVAQRARDERRQTERVGGKSRRECDIVMQALFYPITHGEQDFASRRAFADGYFLTRRMMEWYGEQYARSVDDLSDPKFSPGLAEDLSDLPPALIVTAQFDPLRDEGERYAEDMRAAGVAVICRRVPGTIHGFLNFYPVMRKARRVMHVSGRALRKAFAASPP